MNKNWGKKLCRDIALLTIFCLLGTTRESTIAQASGEIKAGKSSAERGDSLLALESIDVDPAKPGPETLCKLRVRVRNKGGQAANYFFFAVLINGQEAPAYKNHAYVQTIAPGAVEDIQLFNFWTTEPGRPAPKDGQLRVEVVLKEARWAEDKVEGKVTEHRLLGSVEGLPVKIDRTITLGNTGGP